MGSAASKPIHDDRQRPSPPSSIHQDDSLECEGGVCPMKTPIKKQQKQQQENAPTTMEATTPATGGEDSTSGGGGGGCPMKRGDGTYSYSLWSALKAPLSHQQQHNDPSHQPPQQQQQAQTPSLPQYNVYSQPIDPNNKMPVAQARHQMPAPTQTVPLSTERVRSTIPKGGGDATTTNATAAAASTTTTWLYPSPQMFYNALVRKQKVNQDDDDDEEEQKQVEMMVQLHNAMNEKTWQDVLQWEALHAKNVTASSATNATPTTSPTTSSQLLKFEGRPYDTSPKAWIKHYLFQQPLPFDRHDWIVVRNDGTNRTVRYVIDYYYNEQGTSVLKHSNQNNNNTTTPSSSDNDDDQNKSILLVDVRPALDSFEALWDRVLSMPYARHVQKTTHFTPLPLAALKSPVNSLPDLRPQDFSSSSSSSSRVAIWQSMIQQQKEQTAAAAAANSTKPSISDQQATRLALQLSQVLKQCQQAQATLDHCDPDDTEAMQQATVQLTMCMAQVVCPLQRDALMKCILEDNNDDDEGASMEVALDTTSTCVSNFFQKVQVAKAQHQHVFDNKK